MHVKPIEAAQARPGASGPGLAADRKTAATVSSDQPPYESDVVLRDGSTLRLRPVRRDDREGLQALHDRLSRESLRSRFFGIPSSTDGEVSRLLRADQDNEFVLVAEAGSASSASRPSSATRRQPVAQKSPLPSPMRCKDAASARGCWKRSPISLAITSIQTFDAYVMPDNERMMRVFLDSGFEVERRLEGGVFHVVLSLAPTALYAAKRRRTVTNQRRPRR